MLQMHSFVQRTNIYQPVRLVVTTVADVAPYPTIFLAVTSKLYCVPAFNPVITAYVCFL